MLVSHRYKFIYTKTSKTAGTSVEAYFEPHCMDDGDWSPQERRAEYVSASGIVGHRGSGRPPECQWWNHMNASLIKRRLGDNVWSSYTKFCTIRNPYDKCVSQFFFLLARGKNQRDESLPLPLQFERWLEEKGPKTDTNRYVIDGRLCMDFLVRHENLHADLERLCGKLGIPWDAGKLPFYKAGIRPREASVDKLYTDKAKKLVRAAYAFELEQFGYSFPLPE